MNDDQLIQLQKLITAWYELRDEYTKQSDDHKLEKISSIGLAVTEAIKAGKIPYTFQLKHVMPCDDKLLIDAVKELFARLSMKLIVFDTGTIVNKDSNLYFVTFVVKQN